MKKVTKAVIPAAGLGTRLLPATKAVPKELLPIINIPTIQHIVKEAVDSGIKEILLIVSKGKEALINHFKQDKKLEDKLLAKNKKALYELVHAAGTLAKIKIIYQDKQNGLGDAIYYAKEFAHGEPVAVLLGDDVVVTKKGYKTALGQCIDAYNKTGKSVVGVQPVEMKVVNKYGVVAPAKKVESKKAIFNVVDMVEKPEPAEAPSNLSILGRYVLTYDIFKAIEQTKFDKTGEIQITNALKILCKKNRVCACNFKGTRYDLGNKFGMVKATIDFALKDDEIKEDVMKFIKSKVGKK